MQMTRAGFWRHAIALAIDVLLLSVVVQVAALVLYPLTAGRIQAEGSLGETRCTASASSASRCIGVSGTRTRCCRVEIVECR